MSFRFFHVSRKCEKKALVTLCKNFDGEECVLGSKYGCSVVDFD